MSCFKINNNRGESLVQVIVSVGISVIVALAVATMLTTQNKEIKALKEGLAIADFQQQLLRSFSDSSLCSSLFLNQTFDTSLPSPSVELANLSVPISIAPGAPNLVTANEALSPLSNSVRAAPSSIIKIVNITGTGTNFSGVLQVAIDEARLVRSLKPPSVLVSVSAGGAGSVKTISNCGTTILLPSCAAGQTIEALANGAYTCVTPTVQTCTVRYSGSPSCTTASGNGGNWNSKTCTTSVYCNGNEKAVAGGASCTSGAMTANRPESNGWTGTCHTIEGNSFHHGSNANLSTHAWVNCCTN